MDSNSEYQDPDYHTNQPENVSNESKEEKIKEIIRREFGKELEIRKNEVILIDQRLFTGRRMLHCLRYELVKKFYTDQKIQLSTSQIQDDIDAQLDLRSKAQVSQILREGQPRLHPSIRKLVGKNVVDLGEILKRKSPRNKSRKNYNAMLKTFNAKEQASTSKPQKTPRAPEPLRNEKVVTFNEARRNQQKHKYRIIIGNTSKYVPGASRADRSTHKWLLYVRGEARRPDVSAVVTAVVVTLHHSYAPHHVVHIDKPPYHVSRRGWGEFPAAVQLHFALPERNSPAVVQHNIVLDRQYTGMQTLGAETVVDVWLYSTKEMLEFEYKDDPTDTPLTMTEDIPNHIENDNNEIVNYSENSTDAEDSKKDIKHLDLNDYFVVNETNVDELIIKHEPLDFDLSCDMKLSLPESKMNGLDSSLDEDRQDINLNTTANYYNNKEVESFPEEMVNNVYSEPTKKRIMKYIDPVTKKIYYLEMDRSLDLSTVQEIIIDVKEKAKIAPINNKGLKEFRKKPDKCRGVSLLKPEVKYLLNNIAKESDSNADKIRKCVSGSGSNRHVDHDHCYIKTPEKTDAVDASVSFSNLCLNVKRINNIRGCVNYLLKKIPLIQDLVEHFPFVVEQEDKYWKYHFAKRRNIEWSRAKLINNILQKHYPRPDEVWRTKQILMYSRLHGFFPVRPEASGLSESNDWSSWLSKNTLDDTTKDIQTLSQLNTLSVFDLDKLKCEISEEQIEILDSDEEVDVTSCDIKKKVIKSETIVTNSELRVIPVDNEDDRLRFFFIEKKCAELGIELKNQDIGNGCCYSTVHTVLLTAMKNFAEELIREALCSKLSEQREGRLPKLWTGSRSVSLSACDVSRACEASSRLSFLTRRHLANT